jgi:hemerythrin-like domain-containing protein
MFLGSFERVAAVIENPPSEDVRAALESALRYFREAAPKHTADEEESLFPRLRRMQHAEAQAAVKTLENLEHDHRHADSLHAEVGRLGRQYLEQGSLAPADLERFRQAVTGLARIYKEHIRVEDESVFPVAGRILSPADKAAIAAEMAARRK